MTTLRFCAKGTASQPNYDLEEAGIRAFIGRRFAVVKVDAKGELSDKGVTRPAWVTTDEDNKPLVTEVSYRPEYVQACQDGMIEAADTETAILCGVFKEKSPSSEPPSQEPKSGVASTPSSDNSDNEES